MTEKKKTNSVFAGVCNVLSIICFAVVIAALLPAVVPKLMGMEAYSVISGSMEPEIPIGSLVLVRKCSAEELQVNDVAAFISGNTIVTHRVVEIDAEKRELITKGDANNSVDFRPVPFADVIGRVEKHIPVLGAAEQFLTNGAGKIYLIIILAAGAIFSILAGQLKQTQDP